MRPIKRTPFILPFIFRSIAAAVVLAAGLAYVSWQARHLITGPEISIGGLPETVQTERVVTIHGVARNATRLYLNGRPIVTDRDGTFAEGVVLENGHTIVGIDAYDRYGRLTHWEGSFVYVERASVTQR